MDAAIAAKDIGFFGPVAFLLAAGGLVIKPVFLLRDDQGKQGIDKGRLTAAIGARQQRSLATRRDLPDMLVKGAQL